MLSEAGCQVIKSNLFVQLLLLFIWVFGLLFVKDRALRVPHDVPGKVAEGAECVFVGYDS